MTPQSPRLLPSVVNLRDLGGLAVADGRRIAPGRLFRSSHFAALAPADEAGLTALRLRTVVDLRGVEERLDALNRGFGPEVDLLHLPIEPRGLGALRELRAAAEVDEAALLALMRSAYRRFVLQHTAEFAALMARLLAPASYPLVFHCTAGKDRTGFGATVLLLALGASREAILADYLRSNDHWTSQGRANDWALLARARAEYLETAYDTMTEGWGSVDGYLESGLGLDVRARRQLADLLLGS